MNTILYIAGEEVWPGADALATETRHKVARVGKTLLRPKMREFSLVRVVSAAEGCAVETAGILTGFIPQTKQDDVITTAALSADELDPSVSIDWLNSYYQTLSPKSGIIAVADAVVVQGVAEQLGPLFVEQFERGRWVEFSIDS